MRQRLTWRAESWGARAYESITGRKDKRTSISDLPLGEAALDARPQEGHDEEAFNFNLEMRKTRARVDELLAQGQVVAAEAYMEERRQLFVANRFFIRKLNQAFFAFKRYIRRQPGLGKPHRWPSGGCCALPPTQ